MAKALSLLRSFLTGKCFPSLKTSRKRPALRPSILELESRITPAIVDLAGSTGWTPIMIGALKDPANDTLAGAADTDIIGDATHGSLYTAFDDNNTPSTADDSLVFRMRINNPTSNTYFGGVAIVGLDANTDGKIDLFFSVDGRNNGQAIRLFDPGTGLNNSPSTTSTSPLPVGILANNGVYPFSASNYSVVTVSAASDPNWNTNADLQPDGKTDVFVSWRTPLADIATVLSKPSPVDRNGVYGPRGATGISGYSKDTVVTYVNFTQTQTGPINGDLNGVGSGYDRNATFTALGVFTSPMSASNPLPAATVINITEPIGDGNLSAAESTSVTISGTTNATVGSIINLVIADTSGGTTDVTTTATVQAGGAGVNTWSVAGVNVSSQADGILTVSALVTVASQTATDTATVSLDKTAPTIAINTLTTAISGRPTFTGTTDLPPGSTLTITIDPDNNPGTNNNIVYSVVVQTGGTWSLNTNLQAPTSGVMPPSGLVSYSKVTATGTDAAGNTTTATILNKPTVNTLSTNDTTPIVSGTWTNIGGDTLAVTVNGVLLTPTITGNIWSVQVISALATGASYEVVATVTRSGSVSDTTTNELTITSVALVTVGIDGGASASSSDTTPTITGTSSILSGFVIIRIDPNNDGNLSDAVTYSASTNGSGNWTLDTGSATPISGIAPSGGYLGTLGIHASDLAGTAFADQVLTIATPTIAISTIISAATTNSFATVDNIGAAANFLNMTEDNSVTVSGSAPNGYTVNLVITDPNGNSVTSNGIAVTASAWSIAGLDLSGLDNGLLTVTATLAGTSITATNSTVTHDKTAPRIFNTTQSTVQKTSGAIYKGSSELVSGTQISVGLYTNNSFTTLDHSLLTTTVDAQGNWSVTTSSNLDNATDPVYIRVQPVSQTTDAAGNIVQKDDSSRTVSQSQGNVNAVINVYPVTGDNLVEVGEISSGITITGDTNQTISLVTVVVTDGATTISKTTTSGSTYTAGTQNWSVSLTSAEVKSLKNGQLTVTGSVADNNSVSVSDIELPVINLASPTLAITDNVPGIATGDVTFTFIFSEPVTGFDITDIGVTNGTKGAFSGSGTTYTLVVTPTATSNGTISVSVAQNLATGTNTGRGNASASTTQEFNTTGAAAAPTVTIDVDNLASSSTPTISGTTTLSPGAPILVTIDPDNDSNTSNNITYSATVQSGNTWSINIATDVPNTGVVPFGGIPSFAKVTATATNAFGISTTAVGLNIPAVNLLLTNDTTPIVTGTWTNIIGDTLEVTVNGAPLTPVITGNIWSVQVTSALTTGNSYQVVATVTRNSTTKTDISSSEVTIDTTAPAVAIISITTDSGTNTTDFRTNDPTLVYVGTAEADASVLIVLKDSANSTLFSVTVIATGGTWSVDRSSFPLAEGTYTLTATATDAAGNFTLATQAVVVDLTAPILAFTSGRSTATATPTITGTTDLPVGATITVKVDPDNDGNYSNAVTYTTTVQTGGLWSVLATTNITGTVGVQASGTDDVGNTSTVTQPLTLNVNTPVITISEPLDANGTLDATEDNSVVITGTTSNIPNGGILAITITDGSITISDTATVNSNAWSLAALNLSGMANGLIVVSANYVDGSGDLYSDTASVLHDKLAGSTISIDSISDDTGVIADFITKDQTLIFTGSATASASVIVVIKNSSNTVVQTFAAVTTNSSGIWTTPVSNSLTDGTYTVEATNGGTTVTQAFTIDTTAPVAGPLDITGATDTGINDLVTKDGKPALTFPGEAGLTITLKGSNGTFLAPSQYTVTFATGTYTVTLVDGNTGTAGNQTFGTFLDGVATGNPADAIDGTYTIVATDNASNSADVGQFIIDTTAPTTPTVNTLSTNTATPIITGTVTLGTGEVLRVTVNSVTYTVGADLTTSSGTWALTIPAGNALPNNTYSVTATVTDIAGNVAADGTSNELVINLVSSNPVVTTSGGTTAFTEGNNTTSTPVVIDSGITVTDADSSTLASATVSITGGFLSGEDELVFTSNPATMGNISGIYTSGTGVLTLTSSGATATVAQWQTALRSVTYTNSSNTPNTATRTVSFVVNDGTNDSNTATKTVSVTSTNDAPIVTTNEGTTAFTEGNNTTSTPLVIDSGITVTDADSSTLASATVSITGGFLSGEDVLAFSNDGSTMGNISGGYTSSTGVLALTGSATVAQWQAALSSVTYTNNSNTPNTSPRTISFMVNDGTNDSNTATKTVSVTSTNDAPIVTTAPVSILILEDVANVIANISFNDSDAGSSSVTVTLTVLSGTLTATSSGGVTVGGTSSSMTLTGSITNINSFIDTYNVRFTTALNATAPVTLTVGIDDNGNTGSGGNRSASTTVTLSIVSVPDVVNVSSTTANGNYKAGNTILVTVEFDEIVTVDTGINNVPGLRLETGTTDRLATYLSGSGTNTLVLSYTVQPGDTTADLDYVTTGSLVLNEGTIKNGSGYDAVLTLPAPGAAGSLGANKAIVIDTTAPVTGPLDITGPTDTGIDDLNTKNGNPAITFTGEAGLTISLKGPNGATLSLFQYTVTFNAGTYTVTLVDGNTDTTGNQTFGTFFNGAATGNPADAVDGLYTIVATDNASNSADVGQFTIDTTAPTVVVTSSLNNLVGNQTATITFTFSETPVGFISSDVVVSGGTISGFAGTSNPREFTAIFTPFANSNANGSIGVNADSYTDVAGNNGQAGSVSLGVDTAGPTVVITSDKPNLEYGQKALLTFTFSEIPVGFDVSDISVTGGTLGTLTVDPTNPRVYTILFTPTKELVGAGLISLANGLYTDASGNTGTGGSLSPEISIHTKVRGFVATGDGSANGGPSLTPNANTNGTSAVLYDPTTGRASGSTVPFPGYQGQVRVSRADTNGDNTLDMVVSAGAGVAPVVKILDSSTGNLISEITAYAPTFTGGIFVSVMDVNQDGFAEIVTGAGPGGGPHVKLFDGRTHAEIASFFAYDPGFTGGVSVASFDVDLDGILDIVTGAGPGGGPHVKVYSGADMHLIKEFMAYDVNFTGGVFVAVGDFMSNGTLDIITGAGPGGGPHLKVWDYQTLNLYAEKMVYDKFTENNGQVVDSLFGGGVRVGLADGNDDGILDIITGAGPGGGPHVKVLAGFNLEIILNFFSGEMTDGRGVFVSN